MWKVDISCIVNLFNGVSGIQRTPGNLELLIGKRYVNIHPTPIAEVEGLMLFSSKFDTNRILGGSHCLLKEADYLEKTALTSVHSQIRNARVMFDKHLGGGIDFFTSEEFGIKLFPKCDHCKNCKNCT